MAFVIMLYWLPFSPPNLAPFLAAGHIPFFFRREVLFSGSLCGRLDVGLSLFAFEAMVFIAEHLVETLEFLDFLLKSFDQVERLADDIPRLIEIRGGINVDVFSKGSSPGRVVGESLCSADKDRQPFSAESLFGTC